MANAYKIAQVTLNAANSDFSVISGTAATTLVKGVYFSHEDHNTVVQLSLTKHNGSRITIREVDHVAGEMTQLLPDTMALEANDVIRVQSTHISSTDVGYVTVNYVESTTGVTAQSIGVLNDVDVTSTAPTNGQVLIWNDSDSEFQPGDAGGSTATLDDIGNVNTTSKVTGDVVKWNGSSWVKDSRVEVLYDQFRSGTGATSVFADGATTTDGRLELDTSTAKLKTGVTGIDVTESSPGELDFIVAAGAAGSETAFTALELNGETSSGVATFTINDGTFFHLTGPSGYARIQHTGGNVAITLPSSTGTLAKLTDISANSDVSANTAKLAGIAAGAEVNVNADWNATSGDAQILNKPSIPSDTNLSNTNLTQSGNRSYDHDGNTLTFDLNDGGEFVVEDTSDVSYPRNIECGTGVVSIQGLIYPDSDGTSGQVITTNGSGVLSFTTVSGGVTAVTGTAPIVSNGGNTPVISISAATTAAAGSMSAADKVLLNTISGSFVSDGGGGAKNVAFESLGGISASAGVIVSMLQDTTADNTNANSKDFLGVVTSTSDTCVINGLVEITGQIPNGATAGRPLWLGTSGTFISAAPTATNAYARVVGHYVGAISAGSYGVFFNPSNDWIQID